MELDIENLTNVQQYLCYYFRTPILKAQPTLEGWARSAGFQDKDHFFAAYIDTGLLSTPHGKKALEGMTTAKLKELLRKLGKKLSGRKNELINRILETEIAISELLDYNPIDYLVTTRIGDEVGSSWKNSHETKVGRTNEKITKFIETRDYFNAYLEYHKFRYYDKPEPFRFDDGNDMEISISWDIDGNIDTTLNEKKKEPKWLDPKAIDPDMVYCDSSDPISDYIVALAKSSTEYLESDIEKLLELDKLGDWDKDTLLENINLWALHRLDTVSIKRSEVDKVRRINEWLIEKSRVDWGDDSFE